MKFIGYNNNVRIVAIFVIVDLQALFYRQCVGVFMFYLPDFRFLSLMVH